MFWNLSGIIVASLFVIGVEVPYLRRKGYKKELLVFSMLLAAGILLSVLEVIKIPLPNPLDMITAVYQPISDFVYALLGASK
ncbi:hypothetical protein [Paenibacillus montanisoli]|uniref:Uncharacterized protein n=1 Tax=Paenibacillus montanisoli TaxID=2081970 RepID=A0A328U6N0_9BACL|nr:hypothetical protein [Paenibacillus montanisoli]RAP75744.1 hypothetical protein DL346_09845 [Paenibacillus montanisoli]